MDLKRWVDVCTHMREKVVQHSDGEPQKYLLAKLSGTAQQGDIEKRTPLVGDFCRVKLNVKGFNPAERAKKGLPEFDFHDDAAIFKGLRDEFDMPYWAFVKLANVPLSECANTFIYQLKGCNIHCP